MINISVLAAQPPIMMPETRAVYSISSRSTATAAFSG